MDTPQFNIPAPPKVLDYPAVIGIALGILFTTILLIVSNRFDTTRGILTISLLVIIAFIGVLIFSVFYVIPNNEATSNIIGGLIAAFSTVIAYWITKSNINKDK